MTSAVAGPVANTSAATANDEAGPGFEAEIDVNAMRDSAIQLYELTSVDVAYTFYYDETNNTRRLSVSCDGLNVLGRWIVRSRIARRSSSRFFPSTVSNAERSS
jgi:hypothetical protein